MRYGELLFIPLGKDRGISLERKERVIGPRFGYRYSHAFQTHKIWAFNFLISWRIRDLV